MVSSTPRLHFTPGKDQVPILQEAGWAPGPVWTGGKSRHHRDSIPDGPVRSSALYRLCYPAHKYTCTIKCLYCLLYVGYMFRRSLCHPQGEMCITSQNNLLIVCVCFWKMKHYRDMLFWQSNCIKFSSAILKQNFDALLAFTIMLWAR